jgi:hypothetical protein
MMMMMMMMVMMMMMMMMKPLDYFFFGLDVELCVLNACSNAGPAQAPVAPGHRPRLPHGPLDLGPRQRLAGRVGRVRVRRLAEAQPGLHCDQTGDRPRACSAA